MIHTEAVVITCIDYRLQPILDRWLQEHLGYGNYNRVALAGSVKNWDVIRTQIDLSRRVHSITRVVLMNHEDCRAYGDQDSPRVHFHDLRAARERVLEQYPDMAVDLYYVHLDGQVDRVE
jgi:carbonic anhydrase